MKYYAKQSSMFILMSILLCLITFSYEDQSNKFIESLKKSESENKLETNSGKPFTFIPKGWVNIRGSNKFCLHDNQNGKGITQGPCGTKKEALWKFISIGGKYIITAKSKRVLNDKRGKKNNGNPIISMMRHNGYNQKWIVKFIAGPALTLTNFYSDKCIDNSSSQTMGTNYVQWTCKAGNPNQIYNVIPPVDPSSLKSKLTTAQKIAMSKFTVPLGYVSLLGDTGLCVTEMGKDKILSQKKCTNEKNNLWKFKKVSTDLYSITSKSGIVLTNKQSVKKNGNFIVGWDNEKGKNQQWNVIPLPNGKFLLRNPESAKCVDIDGKIEEGSKHNIYECGNTKKSQMLTIKTAEGKTLSTKNLTKNKKCSCPKDPKKIKPKISIFPQRKSRRSKSNNGKNGNGNGNGNGGDACGCKTKKNPLAPKTINKSKSAPKKSKKTKKSKRKQRGKFKAFHAPKDWINIVGKDKLCVISAAKGGMLTQGKCGKYSDALWKITKIEEDNYTIVAKNGMALENKNGSAKSNNPIISNKNNKGPNQRWSFHNIKDKKLMIENVITKKCLDVADKAKLGNGYVQSDCLKGNDGGHFKLQTLEGKKINTKKVSKKSKKKILKKKFLKKIKDGKKESKKKIEYKKLKCSKIKTETDKKIQKAKQLLKKKIKTVEAKDKKKLKKILEDIKKADSQCQNENEKKKILERANKALKKKKKVKELKKIAKKIQRRVKKLTKTGNKDKAKKLKKIVKKLNKKVKKQKKQVIKKLRKKIAKKVTAGKKEEAKPLKKRIKKIKMRNNKRKKKVLKKLKKKIAKKVKAGKKDSAKKLKKKVKTMKIKMNKRKIKQIKKDEKKIKKLINGGKKEKADKLKKKVEKKKKSIKKNNKKKTAKKDVKKAKKTVNDKIKNLVKKGKTEKAKLLKKVLKKMKRISRKVSKKPKAVLKKIKKEVQKAIHIEYKADPTKIQKKSVDLPRGILNITGKTGLCIKNGKKATKALCGNKNELAWKIKEVGKNEYQIIADDGNLLTNKGGVNKSGNPIECVKQTKPERNDSNIWSFTPINNGQFIIYNTATKKCLDTTNKTNIGSGYTLENCRSETTNDNQLFSFNKVITESMAKNKSNPELLKLGSQWVQLMGASKLCLKSTGEGSPLEQSKCESNEMSLWRITPMGENEFFFQNKAGFKISIRNGAKNPKGIISNHLTLDTEKFDIISLKAGRYMMKNKSVNKCLDTDGKPKDSGIYKFFKCKKNDEGQTFKFVKPTSVKVVKSWINIVGPNFLCLKNSGKGKKITQAQCNDSAEMLWKFEIESGNIFTIVNKKDQTVIDLSDSKIFKGNTLISNARSANKSQRWNVQTLKKGKISLRGESSGKCLDSGKIKIGSTYRIWDCSKKLKEQQFRLQYPRPGPATKIKIVWRTKSGKIVENPNKLPKGTHLQTVDHKKNLDKNNTNKGKGENTIKGKGINPKKGKRKNTNKGKGKKTNKGKGINPKKGKRKNTNKGKGKKTNKGKGINPDKLPKGTHLQTVDHKKNLDKKNTNKGKGKNPKKGKGKNTKKVKGINPKKGKRKNSNKGKGKNTYKGKGKDKDNIPKGTHIQSFNHQK